MKKYLQRIMTTNQAYFKGTISQNMTGAGSGKISLLMPFVGDAQRMSALNSPGGWKFPAAQTSNAQHRTSNATVEDPDTPS
jgi:hypothetical protein